MRGRGKRKGSYMRILQNMFSPLARFHGVCSDGDLKASLVYGTVYVLKHYFIIKMLCFLCGTFPRIMGSLKSNIHSLIKIMQMPTRLIN